MINEDDRALEEMQRAIELDPISPLYYADRAWVNYVLENYDKAIEESQKSLKLYPDFVYGLFTLGLGYVGKNMIEDAIAAHKKAGELSLDWKWGLAVTYAMSGQRDNALEIAQELESRNVIWDTWCLAAIYAVLGDKEKSLYWLEAGYQQRHPWMQWIVKNDQYFDVLIDEPRYTALVNKLNIPK
jgi:tetratricopeptide (TPR) repeat protein